MMMGEDTIQGIKDMIAVCSLLAAYPIFLLIKCCNVRSSAAKSACPSMPGHHNKGASYRLPHANWRTQVRILPRWCMKHYSYISSRIK
jgi:hypothetical protein